jgi:hypothetical protein
MAGQTFKLTASDLAERSDALACAIRSMEQLMRMYTGALSECGEHP